MKKNRIKRVIIGDFSYFCGVNEYNRIIKSK